MKDDATRFSGSIPEHYDAGLGPVLFRHYADVLGRTVALTHPRRVLEAAAGTGISSAAILEHNPGVELVVTDLNDAMLQVARRKLPPETRIQVANAQELPFEDASFDAVACQYGIMFLPDPGAAFREARRVLAPGGVFVFSVWDSHAKNRFAAITDGLLKETFPDDPPTFYRVPFSMSAVDPLRDLAQESGFGELIVDVLPYDSPVASWADFADGVIAGNPVSEQVRARSGDVDALIAEVAARLEAEYGPAPTTIPLQTILYRAFPR
ncbi:methyltransferase domain-containing protein [Leifsonia sp. fls2-241-R2A-40a]|uniref:class I SAM-dependent methyltransferase n=1 Tax=Leifsonia sp. fls2-241-R2A-40a TaxID=3040290 RepID=UPI00254A96CE|nr:methyltransferase domain-containing protein [Leifsonia sp. fls2-241-R2A-40a]